MLRILTVGIAAAMSLNVLSVPAWRAAESRPVERIVGLGFEDVVDNSEALPALADRLDQVHATGVSLSVGRVDWSAFPWPGHPQAWSGTVADTGRDYVAEAIRATATRESGQRRGVVLVIDALVEGWIHRDPSIAGVDAQGRSSADFPALSQLESGPVGQQIAAFAGAVAERYRPQAVSLTELFNASHTFGSADLDSYRRHTGAADWPRTSTGEIDESHASIGAWRSGVIAGLVSRVRAQTQASGVPLWMEVRVNWSQPGGNREESGHDYRLLLAAADRLVLWGYFATADRSAGYLRQVSAASRQLAPGRIVMSVGLWGDPDEDTITPRQLVQGSRATVAGGLTSVWVTPASRMQQGHWQELAKAWRPQ